MKTVYVCSPYRGKNQEEVDEHTAYAVTLMEYVLTSGIGAPIVPHLYFPLVLKDTFENDRKTAMACGKHLIEECDLMVAGCRYGISEGMQDEIMLAHRMEIPVIYIDAEPKKIVGIFDMIDRAENERIEKYKEACREREAEKN